MDRFDSFAKWVVAVTGTLVLTALQTGPDALTSNAAAWAKWAGMKDVPTWLLSPRADAWGMAFGWSLIGVFVLWVIIPWWVGRKPVDRTSPDMPLHAALDYLAQRSRWSAKRWAVNAADRKNRVAAELSQQLAAGRLQSWSVRDDIDARFGRFTREIPKTFWLRPNDVAARLSAGQVPVSVAAFDAQGSASYPGVTLNAAQVEAVWPPRFWVRVRRVL